MSRLNKTLPQMAADALLALDPTGGWSAKRHGFNQMIAALYNLRSSNPDLSHKTSSLDQLLAALANEVGSRSDLTAKRSSDLDLLALIRNAQTTDPDIFPATTKALDLWDSALSLTGAGAFDPTLKALAQKIVNAANGYVARTVMSSPPTVSRSGNFANSTIGGGDAGAPSIAPNDAALRPTSLLINQFGEWYGGWNNDDIRLDGGDGWGQGIKTNSANIEISLSFGTAGYKIRFRINGQWMASADTDLFDSFGAPDFGARFIKLAGLGSSTKTIEWFMRHSQSTRGINLDVGATRALPDVPAGNVRARYWGDSYVENNGGLYGVRQGVVQTFGEIMGVLDIIPAGRSNQGFVLPRDSRTIASRMVTDVAYTSPAPDIDYWNGSVNDYNQSAATLQTNVATGLAALKANHPNFIVGFSSFKTQNNTIDSTRNAAVVAAAASVADPRVIMIDTQALGWPTIAATTGLLPNGASHDSLDGVHPGANEVAYLTGTLMKPAVIAALQARAGL